MLNSDWLQAAQESGSLGRSSKGVLVSIGAAAVGFAEDCERGSAKVCFSFRGDVGGGVAGAGICRGFSKPTEEKFFLNASTAGFTLRFLLLLGLSGEALLFTGEDGAD